MKPIVSTSVFYEIIVAVCLFGYPPFIQAQSSCKVIFKVDMSAVKDQIRDKQTVGIRGSLAPLSWEQTFSLSDEDEDGIFTGILSFPSTDTPLEYKYVYGNTTWELSHEGNRRLSLSSGQTLSQKDTWNYTFAVGQDQLASYQISANQLQEEVALMRKAYTELHPGLYRYTDSLSMEKHFDALSLYFQQPRTLKEAYKAYSQLLAKIRCGHTYANFWNQTTATKQALIVNDDKIPFTFRLQGKRMFVDKNASEEERLTPGTEIFSLNGVPVPTILDSLLTVVKGDGFRNEKRLYDLQVNGISKYEAFDVYYPLFFPVSDNVYELVVKQPESNSSLSIQVAAITPAVRRERLSSEYPDMDDSPEALWKFRLIDEQTAYLKLGTFVMWNSQLNWKKFLRESFASLKEQKIPNLIIDIRGNEGGLDAVNEELGKYLISQKVNLPMYKSRLGYQSVPASLKPYLSTWDSKFMDLGNRVLPAEGRLYRWKNEEDEVQKLSPRKEAYTGKIYLMVDAGNSSATFYLAKIAKQNKLATLVGSETGGNLKGINGGIIFFMRMPHSQIEMDIPVMATFPHSPQPDAGIRPNIEINFNPEDLARGIDSELNAVLKLIKAQSP